MHILDESEIEKTVVERDPVLPAPQSAPSPARPLIGQTRIGFGLVVDTIGAGGMASVYKVWNERLELFRAVKMLSLDTLHARFETEAKITAKLRHPHIVEVYNIGEWNGVPYMEMEYVDGGNLQETLDARGRLPDAVCCAAGLCVASALHYAHTLKFTLGGNSYDGIIHRDLKPANILVSKRSEIKLTDFGIARPAQAGLHTIDGNIVGTLHYLSPEQLGGGQIDPRSDIYSFGAILYEMATGTKTFPQKSIPELTMRRAANSFKPPSEYDPPVPPALSNIILKCLKAPAQERYQNTAELIGDLQRAYAKIAKENAPQKTLYKFFSGDTEDAGVTPTVLINADLNVNVNIGTNVDNVDTDNANAVVNTDNAVSADNINAVVDTDNTVSTDNINAVVNIDNTVSTDDVNAGVNTDIVVSADVNTVDSVNSVNSVNTVNTIDTVDKNIDTNVNIDTDNGTVVNANQSSVKRPPAKRKTVYAAAAMIAVLSASYLTIRLISRPSPQKDNKHSVAATKFFSTPVNTDAADPADTDVSASVNTPPPVPTAPVNNTKPTNAVSTADVNIIDIDTTDVGITDVNTAGINTINIDTADVNTIDINTKAAHHGAAPAPPITESALIKSAAEAIGKKEWDRAIRILEKNSVMFTEKRGVRHLMLLEAYIESRRLDKARSALDSAAQTNDALYFLTAGRYHFYRNDHPRAIAALETSLTRPSALRNRGAVIGEALYYIALIRSYRFKAAPTEATRKQAQEAWKRVKSAYESKPESPQFKRAEEEILELY
ncbi:MAG: protein kinase [Chitinispirillales bacterium]|jgi:serine/threonine protein kinase|nr:protein kinase [Chitinispirillales bacterium]